MSSVTSCVESGSTLSGVGVGLQNIQGITTKDFRDPELIKKRAYWTYRLVTMSHITYH